MTHVHHIYQDKNVNFDELKCKVLYVNDLNEQVKFKAVRKIIEHFLLKHMRINDKDNNIKLSILIPEKLCSLFIGKEGKNIKGLMFDTRTQIDLHTEKYQNGFRPVDIKGTIDNIDGCIEKINRCLENFNEKQEGYKKNE